MLLQLVSLYFVMAHLTLVNLQKSFQFKRLQTVLGISPQSRAAMDVGDKCYKDLPPCDSHARYRTYDGLCNNLEFPMWGLTDSAAIRVLPASYSDGRSLPRLSAKGDPLPNSREVRLKLIFNDDSEDLNYWTLFQSWSQFIAHDTGSVSPKVDGVSCCTSDGQVKDPFSKVCLPILVSKNDSFYSLYDVNCIDMFRAKTIQDFGCHVTEVANQIMPVTHFIDASPVYGSDKATADSLRLFEKGLLRFQTYEGEVFPPNVDDPKSTCDIRKTDPVEVCYKAGDGRVNQNPAITPLHILFLRVHNSIALELCLINPQWNDETIFQETRRIVIAIVQLITYKEFLPILIGEPILKKLDMFVHPHQTLEKGYDENLNPNTISEFINSAYRSLHSVIVPKLNLEMGYSYPEEFDDPEIYDVDIVDYMHRPQIAQCYYEELMKGQQTQFMRKYSGGEFSKLNNMLSHGTKPYGPDLEALSIHRQLDFGTPSYNNMRVYSQLRIAKTFEDLNDVMYTEDIERFKAAYKNVNDIDLFTGGLYEKPVPGALVGVTFWKLMVDQFFRWKFGDRFFFTFGEQKGSFKPAQLAEIMKVSSGWLYCVGVTGIGYVHPNNMNNKLKHNEEVPCSALPKMDLTKWKKGHH